MTQVSVSFDGANQVAPVGLEQAQARFNYLRGPQENWHSGVPSYEVVAYQGLYDGIDLRTWGQRDSLKYEFHVAPGADYRQIQVCYAGIEGLTLGEEGTLWVDLGGDWGPLVDDAPYVYQVIDGERIDVASRFVLRDASSYTFDLTGPYDPAAELVIDPDLAWSTYLGGTNGEEGNGIAVDGAGNALVTGTTFSSDFAGANNPYHGGSWDAFVAKIDFSAPTVGIVDVTPDPRTTAVDGITIVFSEAVSGFELVDLSLARDGGSNLLTASQTLTTSDNITWELWNLSSLTGKAGSYVLALTAAGSGITDLAGNALAGNASDDWVTNSTIAGRHLFYNNSKFDGHAGFLNGDPAANEFDDRAIAPDKEALLPGGGTAAFKNYTTFYRGINGIMIDVAGLPGATLAAADFVFKYGNDSTPGDWLAAADPTTIAVRAGAGTAARIASRSSGLTRRSPTATGCG